MKRVILAIAVLISASMTSFSQSVSADSAMAEFEKMTEALRKKLINNPLPDFSLTDLNGKERTNKEFKGKVVVINFWFTSCRPCLEEMPLLNELVKKYKDDKDVVFLAPALDGKSLIEKFLKKRSFDYLVLPESLDYAEKLSITAFPTHLIVDADGVVKEIAIGGSENIAEWLEENIRKVKRQ